jgi:hypothetical protein
VIVANAKLRDASSTEAGADQVSPLFVEVVITISVSTHSKQEGGLEWRIGRANLPKRWSQVLEAYRRTPGTMRTVRRARPDAGGTILSASLLRSTDFGHHTKLAV